VEGPNLFIGIDPGKSGGICATNGTISICSKCPGTVADMVGVLSAMLDIDSNPMCVIESVHSMPGQGVASTFTFGTNYGMWLGNQPCTQDISMATIRHNKYYQYNTLVNKGVLGR
jgi:hypothetical protein